MTRSGNFIGKGFCNDGLFTLDVEINACSSSTYFVESSIDLWHSRLGHVNTNSVKSMKKLSLLPDLNTNNDMQKCKVCVEAKHPKKPFRSVTERESKVLELVHTDLTDFKNCLSKGGKKYYITFADDCSRYTKIYLFRSKDEAEETFLKYKAEVEN